MRSWVARGLGAQLAPLLLALGCEPQRDSAAPAPLTVVTLNTHSFQEGEDSLEKLALIGEGLAALDVDLVGLNEVMSGTFWSYDYGGATHDGTALIQEALEAASGEEWAAHSIGFAHWDSGEQMSNVVLSRFPLLHTADADLTTTDFWPAPAEQRSVVHARIQVPELGPVAFFVTHTWGWDSVDTLVQVDEVKAFMAAQRSGDEVLDLLVGDLNVPSTDPAYSAWLSAGDASLYDTYGLANPDGFTDSTSHSGQDRIDYVLVGEAWGHGADPACYRSVLIFDGAEQPAVSDHLGVMTTFDLTACP